MSATLKKASGKAIKPLVDDFINLRKEAARISAIPPNKGAVA